MDDGGRAVAQRLSYAPVEQPVATDAFGLREITGVFMRRWRTILVTFGAVASAAALIALVRPPMYEAPALIMISPSQQTPATSAENQPQAPPDSAAIDSAVEVLRSRVLAERLTDRLGLVNNPAWNPHARDKNRTFTPRDAMRERGAVVQAVQRSFDIRRQGQTYVVNVTARSYDPDEAARLANTLATLFLESQAQARAANIDRSSAWLSRRLGELQNELERKEAAAAAYRARAGLLTSDGVPLTEQQIGDVQNAVMAARADVAEKEARYRQVQAIVRAGGSADSISGAISSDTITQLRAREADVARRQADMEQRYGPLHPALQNVRAERADIRDQISAEVSRVAANAGNEVAVARSRLSTLEANLASVRGQLASDNGANVELRQLEREATAARTVYESFMQRWHMIAEQADVVSAGAQIISNATSPSAPASKHGAVIVLIAAALGLIAGVIAAFVRDHFDLRLVSADDVERVIGLSVLSSIPRLRPRDMGSLPQQDQHPAGFLAAHPMSGFTEAFRVLRVAILNADFETGRDVIAVTSALPGEGKTSTALCLARAAAMSGQKVIIVDCDLRRRSLNHYLGIEPTHGVLQVLRGECGWREVVGRDETSNADVLAAASSSFTPVDVFGAAPMKRLVQELSREYDLVVLDCPPILTLAETRSIVSEATGVIVVARSGRTEAPALHTAVRQLHGVNANVLGVAFNDVPRNAPGRSSYADPLYFTPSMKGFYST